MQVSRPRFREDPTGKCILRAIGARTALYGPGPRHYTSRAAPRCSLPILPQIATLERERLARARARGLATFTGRAHTLRWGAPAFHPGGAVIGQFWLLRLLLLLLRLFLLAAVQPSPAAAAAAARLVSSRAAKCAAGPAAAAAAASPTCLPGNLLVALGYQLLSRI